MAPRTSWRKLLPGLVALAVVLLGAVGVLAFAGVGQIRGTKVHLFILADQARGVMRGTEVWVAGQKVGLVDAVRFRGPSADTTGRVVIAVSVRASDAKQIRRDSPSEVRAGFNVIGPVVVYFDAGSPASPPAREGDTLRARAQSDLVRAGERLTVALANLRPTMADARVVLSRVHDRNGTIGAVLAGDVIGQMKTVGARFAAVRRDLFPDGDGDSHGEADGAEIDVLLARARSALARADTIRALIDSPQRSIGRFRRDATLAASIASVRDDVARVRRQLATSTGTLYRLSSDSALSRSLAETQSEMARLFDDMRRHPLRYLPF